MHTMHISCIFFLPYPHTLFLGELKLDQIGLGKFATWICPPSHLHEWLWQGRTRWHWRRRNFCYGQQQRSPRGPKNDRGLLSYYYIQLVVILVRTTFSSFDRHRSESSNLEVFLIIWHLSINIFEYLIGSGQMNAYLSNRFDSEADPGKLKSPHLCTSGGFPNFNLLFWSQGEKHCSVGVLSVML